MKSIITTIALTDEQFRSVESRKETLSVEALLALVAQEKAEQWHQQDADNYARDLYERIQAADPATQQAIFAAAEQALS